MLEDGGSWGLMDASVPYREMHAFLARKLVVDVLSNAAPAIISPNSRGSENCMGLIDRTCSTALIFPISKVIIRAASEACQGNLAIDGEIPPTGARLLTSL